MILFVVSCFLIRAHPQPYPLDITTTQALQNLQDVPWAAIVLHFVGAAIDPLIPIPTYPSGHVEFAVVFYGFLLFLSFSRPSKSDIRTTFWKAGPDRDPLFSC
jgi:hypothetical protein